MTNIDAFWFDDPYILINRDRLTEFFPIESMHYKEKLNAIVRFSIYWGIFMFIQKKNANILLLPLFVAAITLYIYRFNKLSPEIEEEMGNESHSNAQTDECQMPSKENPFMNVLISDIQHNPNKKEACKISDESVKKQVENHFNYNLYRDVSDVYQKNNSQRQFVSNPNTQIPNDQGAFAQYLYGWGASCKEDNTACLRYEDLRQKRRIHLESVTKPDKSAGEGSVQSAR